ncbi:MAG: DUF308 domain-containing protein [Bacteroidales bacterium]
MKRSLSSLFAKTGKAIKYWWLLLIAGIALCILGIVVFFYPAESYITLALFFGIMMLVTGIAELVLALTNRSFFTNRGWMIAGAIIDLVLGILLCINPGISAIVMPILLGFWLLYRSFLLIGFGGDMAGFKISGSGWTIAGGVLLMICSFFVIFQPLTIGSTLIVFFLGTAFLISGLSTCQLAWKLKDIHKKLQESYTDYEEAK